MRDRAGIPSQCLPHLGRTPQQLGGTGFGVRSNGADAGNFDYVGGAE